MANTKRNRTYILLVGIIISLIVLLSVLERRSTEEENVSSETPSTQNSVVSEPKPLEKEKELPPQANRLFIIIDDVGYNTSQLEPFLKLDYPIIFSVLPGLPHTRAAAKKITAAGKEVMLHLPMEAKNGKDPGPGAVYADMERPGIEKVVRKHLDELPEAKAVNNHMGSLITEDSGIMEIILAVAKKRNIVYIDSLTTSKSAVPMVSKKLRIPYYSRDIFLDNKKEKASMAEALYEGIKIASKKGSAILIGHIGSAELAGVISESGPLLEQFDVEIVGLEKLVEQISLAKEESHEHTWH